MKDERFGEMRMVNEGIKELNKKFDRELYIEVKMKLNEGCRSRIEVLRRMYRDRDIGCRNWMLYEVKKGKKWFRKSDRKK